jgi:hypothetical protein
VAYIVYLRTKQVRASLILTIVRTENVLSKKHRNSLNSVFTFLSPNWFSEYTPYPFKQAGGESTMEQLIRYVP